MNNRRLIKDYGTITLSTAQVEQDQIAIPVLGDLEALDFEVTNAVTIGTGAVGTGIKASDVLKYLVITDKATAKVADLRSKDIPRLIKIMHIRGQSVTDAVLATGATVFNGILRLPISVRDQPCKIKITTPALADLFSTVGTATMTTNIKIFGLYSTPNLAAMTTKILTFNTTGAVGDNTLSEAYQNASSGKMIVKTAIFVSDETTPEDASISYATLRSGTREELEAMTPQHMINEETFRDISAHLTGLFKLQHTAFLCTKNTTVSVTLATARTGNNFRTYIITEA